MNKKTKFRRNNDIRFVTPLYNLSTIMGISPPNNFQFKQSKSKIYEHLTVIRCVILTISFILSFLGNMFYIYPYTHTTIALCEGMLFLMMTMTTIISTLRSGFWHREEWNNMIESFLILDDKFKIEPKGRNLFMIEFILGHLVLFLVLSNDAYFNLIYYGFKTYKFYFFNRIQYYFVFLVVLLICNFALSIRNKYKCLNNLLINTFKNKDSDNGKVSFSVTEFALIFSDLERLVCTFNTIFGWNILLIFGIVLLSLLSFVNLTIFYNVIGFQDRPFGEEILILSSLLTAIVVVTVLNLLLFL